MKKVQVEKRLPEEAAPSRKVSEIAGHSIHGRQEMSSVPAAMLWLMVWMGYNTEISRLFEPGFPAGFFDFFHGVRSLLPFVAAFVAIVVMFMSGSLSLRRIKGPVGLLFLYVFFGIVSSTLFSRDPWTATYWVAEYSCALIVIWVIMSDTNPFECLSRPLNVNAGMVIGATAGLLGALGFFADLFLVETQGSPMGVEAFGGSVVYNTQILDMPSTRNTGFGRFAALGALICVARLREGKKQSRFFWVVLPVCLIGLVLSQARTSVIAFLAGIFVVFWFKPGSKKLTWIGSLLVLILLGVTGFYSVFWGYITRGGAFDPTLSGRTVTWQEAWNLFQQSPLFGLGFHADRIYLSYLEYATHTHNALLHALIQTGVLGTLPLLAGLVIAWILVFRLYRGRAFSAQASLPLEVPCVLAFVTASSMTESTFALYNVYWIMVAPCFAYLQVAHQQRAVELRHAAREPSRPQFVRPGFALPKATPRGG